MEKIFSTVDKFFSSLHSYFTYNEVFIFFVGLFLLTVIIIAITTSHAYESKLVKAIDMFNNYFIDNPKITEDNLVAFNQKMRHKKVPKQLRKQWQQYVLYRENKASYYMSFENCVSIPLRNSKIKRDKLTMNCLAYIFATAALLLNIYIAYESDFAAVIQKVLLAPAIILLINLIASIFLDLKANAIVSDLNQNFQYFEVNIDKATQTLPEYVDYEILFDRNEIKRGIPILYQYLQKRAEEEQRELEKARLRNVEHEKFNFDEAGLAGSLVLERAMQEAENYIAERKKYNQDIEQINGEITQEDMAYRETTKEYNRQMQVSKETFANFKSQLEQASSTIETNYLKKQQQQELDRQRNLERDFDTATERHKKVIESYQAELDNVDEFIAKSRKSLQDAMMSEFSTYSGKVYDEAKKVVEEREKEKYAKVKQEIKNLEEKLHAKNKELETVYNTNQALTEKLEAANITVDVAPVQPKQEPVQPTYVEPEPVQEVVEPEVAPVEEQPYVEEQSYVQEEPSYVQPEENVQQPENVEEPVQEEQPQYETQAYVPSADFYKNDEEQYVEDGSQDRQTNETQEFVTQPYVPSADFYKNDEEINTNQENLETENLEQAGETVQETNEDDGDETEEFFKLLSKLENSTVQEESKGEDGMFEWVDDEDEESEEGEDDSEQPLQQDVDLVTETNKDEDQEMPVRRKAGRPRKVVPAGEEKPKGRPGRPRKVKTEDVEQPVKKGRGRPRKQQIEEEIPAKKKAGRPRKVEANVEPKKGRGRPKKTESVAPVKSGRGRPRKTETANVVKAGRGRPRKVETTEVVKKKAGRPKKSNVEVKPKRNVGRPKKETSSVNPIKKGRGRPKKVSVNADVDFEQYLKVIDDAIAEENAKMKKSQKALESNANIKTKRKK